MKETDLMINDYVMVDNKPHRVSKILKDSICVNNICTNNATAFECYPFEDLEPILLTSEILEKNGFELVETVDDGYATLYEKWKCKTMFQIFHLFYDGNKKDYSINTFEDYIEHILYVHELQHAMRVCEIEKEIEL